MTAYQDAPDPPLTPELRAASEQAMHVLTDDGQVLVGDQAVIHVYERLGFGVVAALRLPPLRWLTPALYQLVANNRRSLAPWFFRRE